MNEENINSKQYFIKAVIDRFEGKQAVIRTDDGHELIWPVTNLPDEAKEGTSIRLILSTSKTDEEEREKIAKSLLNEILKKDKTSS
jgi:hypothetical protein